MPIILASSAHKIKVNCYYETLLHIATTFSQYFIVKVAAIVRSLYNMLNISFCDTVFGGNLSTKLMCLGDTKFRPTRQDILSVLWIICPGLGRKCGLGLILLALHSYKSSYKPACQKLRSMISIVHTCCYVPMCVARLVMP